MRIFKRITYYARSILTILSGFSNPIAVLIFFLSKSSPDSDSSFQVQLKKSGLKFEVRTPMDVWSIKETFLDDFYRFEKSGKRENMTIIDIGAGIGEFAIQAAAGCPECKVFGFEPFIESLAFFERNIELNGLKDVHPIGAAVTSVPGNLVMDTSSGNPLQYRMQTGTSEDHSGNVNTVALIDFMDKESIQKCNILKLDCEGGEFDILLPLSIRDLVRFERIVMEFHDSLTAHHHQELVELLKSAGFRVEILPNQVHSDLGYIYAQLI